jgi:hypothetical protein
VRRLRAALFALELGLVAGAACNNDCYTLAQNICQCESTPQLVGACQNDVSQQNSIQSPNSTDLARCHEMLKTCDCRSLQSGSLQAKVACGLARANPDDKSLNP